MYGGKDGRSGGMWLFGLFSACGGGGWRSGSQQTQRTARVENTIIMIGWTLKNPCFKKEKSNTLQLKSISIMGSLFSLELTSDLSSFFEFSRCYHPMRMKQVLDNQSAYLNSKM